MAKEEFPRWVRPPTTAEEIEFAMSCYQLCGLPGAVGSTDVVHVHYDRAPAKDRSAYDGPKGHPTIAYEVLASILHTPHPHINAHVCACMHACVHARTRLLPMTRTHACTQVTVGHNRWIYYTTEGFPGTKNDKTIVKYDDFVTKVRTGELYGDTPFWLCCEDGTYKMHRGLYLIVDGGYHRWRVSACVNVFACRHTASVRAPGYVHAGAAMPAAPRHRPRR